MTSLSSKPSPAPSRALSTHLARLWWVSAAARPRAALALAVTVALSACSAVVDFEEPSVVEAIEPDLILADAAAPRDDVAAPREDAESDAGQAAAEDSAAAPDSTQGQSCAPEDTESCGEGALCCADDAEETSFRCVLASADQCTACGQPCADPAAPNCGAAGCECKAGTGKGCEEGERCLGVGAAAECVECVADADCADRGSFTQCVDNQCRECDQGASAESAADDEGCSDPARPICSSMNLCVPCSREPDNCPGSLICNGIMGCFGCDLLNPLDTASCGGTRPICRQTEEGLPQCGACENDADCGAGFCDNRPELGTGACTEACAPAGALGKNGCGESTPYCKQVDGSDFACQACVPADCAGQTPYCMTGQGPTQGQCVACRSSADCSTGLPICEPSTGTCRARKPADCDGRGVLDKASGRCVECLTDAQCGGDTAVCGPDHTCVACATDDECTDPSAPLCDQTENRCVACGAVGDWASVRCAAKDASTTCMEEGELRGQCSACSPQRPLNQTYDEGCSGELRFCAAAKGGPLACHECDPSIGVGACLLGQCALVGKTYRCQLNYGFGGGGGGGGRGFGGGGFRFDDDD